jgi:hypothetical protein
LGENSAIRRFDNSAIRQFEDLKGRLDESEQLLEIKGLKIV